MTITVSEPRTIRLAPRVLVVIGCFIAVSPAFAQDDVRTAPARLSLPVSSDPPAELCRHIEASDPASLVPVSLHQTFHDDFDEHPLLSGKWVPHYAGGAAWPEAQYWGGAGSAFKRKTSWN